MKALNGFKQTFIDFIVAYPKKTLAIFFALTAILSGGLAFLQADFSYKVWYNDQDPLMKLYERFERNFGNDDSVIIGLYSDKGIFTKENVELIQEITDEFYQVSEIIRVDNVLNFHDIKADGDEINIEPVLEDGTELSPEKLKTAKKRALSNDILTGNFINQEGDFTIISAQVRPAHDNPPDYIQIAAQAYEVLDKFRGKRPDVKLIVTGPVILTDTFRAVTLEDMAFLIPILYTVFTIILIALFRTWAGVLLPYATITFSTIMMMGTMGYLGLSLNTLSSAVPTILLTVALADAIHILTVYYLAIKNGFAPKDALKKTLHKNFYPTLLTTLTTALGFLSFFDAKIEPVSELGIAVGFGAVYAWLASYILLGPLIALLPTKKEDALEKKALAVDRDIPPSERSLKFADFVARKAWPILVCSFLTGAMGLYLAKNLVVDMDPIKQFPKGHSTNVAYNLIDEKMGFFGTIEVIVESPNPEGAKEPEFLKRVDKLEDWLKSRPYVTSVLSINDYLKKINKAFHNGEREYYRIPPTSQHVAQELFFYSMGLPPEKPIENRINAQRDAVRISVNWTLRSSKESNEKFARINEKAKELGLHARVTGKTPLFHDLTPYVVTTFVTSLSIALATITVVLSLILQSLKLGMFAMLPSVLPLMIGAGAFALSGNNIDMGTVLVASVCLGIAVDDSVHFMFAYKRLIERLSFRETLATIASNVYPSLFNTTLLIVLGFSSFLLGSYIPNAKFGVAVAAILVVALICDFIVLPALLAIFGQKKAAR